MRITLVANEDLLAGDLVSVDPIAAGRVVKARPTGNFEQALAIGMAQNTTAAGNTVVITTDGPSNSNIYRNKLTPGTEYYVGIAAQLVTYAEFKKAVEDGGYDGCFLCHAGSAASTDQLSIDLEAPVSTLTSDL